MKIFRFALVVLVLASGLLPVLAADDFIGHFRQGRLLYDAGKFQEAAVEFEAAHAINPNEPVTRKNLSLCYAQLGQYEKAEPLRRDLCALSRASSDCLPYVEILVAQAKMQEALNEVDRIQGEQTASELAIGNRFRCYAHVSLGQFEQAVEPCRAGEPETYAPIAVNLLLSCLKTGNIEAAKQASATAPHKTSKEWLDITKLWIKLAPDEARKAFLPEFVKTAPDRESKRLLAADLSAKGFTDESTQLYEQLAAEPGSDGCDVAEPLARAYAAAKAEDKAFEWSSKLIKCAPDSASGYALRGVGYYLKQDWDKAIEDLAKSLSITENAGVRANLENAKKYKAGLEHQARAAQEDAAAQRRAQEEYKERVRRDRENFCKQNPHSKECKDYVPDPPKSSK